MVDLGRPILGRSLALFRPLFGMMGQNIDLHEGFHQLGTPLKGWFRMENRMNIEDFEGTTNLGNLCLYH